MEDGQPLPGWQPSCPPCWFLLSLFSLFAAESVCMMGTSLLRAEALPVHHPPPLPRSLYLFCPYSVLLARSCPGCAWMHFWMDASLSGSNVMCKPLFTRVSEHRDQPF